MMGNMWFLRKETSTNKDRDMTEAVSRPSCSTHCGWEMNGERFYARLSDTIEKTFFFSHYQRCLRV